MQGYMIDVVLYEILFENFNKVEFFFFLFALSTILLKRDAIVLYDNIFSDWFPKILVFKFR
jgi:hypothetical protein